MSGNLSRVFRSARPERSEAKSKGALTSRHYPLEGEVLSWYRCCYKRLATTHHNL
jgi:hypothetical protein